MAVSVDGRTLGDADAVSRAPILPEDFLPSGVETPMMIEYGFYCDSGAPQIAAADPNGEAAEVRQDGDSAWTCPLKEDVEFREQYGDAVIKLAERIAKFTVKDLSRESVLRNVASDSPAETILGKFSNGWAPSHKTSTVTDAAVSDFHVWSDSCFTCHVEFTFTLTSRRENDYVYPTAYTLCVVKRGGKGKLYNITFN